MSTAKEKLDEIINYLDDNRINQIIDFAEFLEYKRLKKLEET